MLPCCADQVRSEPLVRPVFSDASPAIVRLWLLGCVLRERLSQIEPGEEAGKILLEQDAPWSTVNFVVS